MEESMLKYTAQAARIADRILRGLTVILAILFLLYGAYSLWETHSLYTNAFVSDELLAYKPPVQQEAKPTLTALQEKNPDVCGWLTIDDTHIDYPFVQGKDDLEYLNLDVFREFAFSGSIFLSEKNSRSCDESLVIVYGHHMENGAMFGDVLRFTEADYFESHQSGWLQLPERTDYIRIFACVKADASDPVIYRGVGDETMRQEYIRTKAVQYRDIGLQPGDRLIALSTCATADTNGRVLLFGRLETKTDLETGRRSEKP